MRTGRFSLFPFRYGGWSEHLSMRDLLIQLVGSSTVSGTTVDPRLRPEIPAVFPFPYKTDEGKDSFRDHAFCIDTGALSVSLIPGFCIKRKGVAIEGSSRCPVSHLKCIRKSPSPQYRHPCSFIPLSTSAYFDLATDMLIWTYRSWQDGFQFESCFVGVGWLCFIGVVMRRTFGIDEHRLQGLP